MIEHGPVDVLVLAAGEPRFDGGVLAELERQAESGTIRVLDAMILLKDEAGLGPRPRGSSAGAGCRSGLYRNRDAGSLRLRGCRHSDGGHGARLGRGRP